MDYLFLNLSLTWCCISCSSLTIFTEKYTPFAFLELPFWVHLLKKEDMKQKVWAYFTPAPFCKIYFLTVL